MYWIICKRSVINSMMLNLSRTSHSVRANIRCKGVWPSDDDACFPNCGRQDLAPDLVDCSTLF